LATNIYLAIPGITGPSTTQGYIGSFSVNSLSWGISTPVTITGGGAGAGKPSLSSVSVQLPLGLGSMPLLVNLAAGSPVKTATIYLVRPGGSASGFLFERYDLSNVFFSSYQTSASGDQPADMLTLAFQKIRITYYTQKADGTVAPNPEVFTWDVAGNRP
jgi:type VI secretion system secreted protein Hcp